MAIWSPLLARPTQTPLWSRPSLTLFFLLVGAFVLTLVPHAVRFPFWLSVSIGLAMALRCVMEVYRMPLPSTTFCGIMAMVLATVVSAQYGGNILGRDPGTALTAGLLTIKFYELRRPRDVALIIFSCFFVVMSALLYDQYLELFVYCLIMMWVLTALLMRVHTGDQHEDALIRMLGQSGVIFLQALPLGLFLFFFLPRYTGVLSFSLDDAKIGITDNVSPGSIAKLSRDGSVAMYVKFNTLNVPTADRLYWRALVLWHYANGAWTPGNLAEAQASPKEMAASSESSGIVQTITLKANNQKWLLALDAPVSKPRNPAESSSWAVMLQGNVAQLAVGKLNHMARYDITSSATPVQENLNPAEREAALDLPTTPNDHINHSVIELADHLHAGLTDLQEMEYVTAVVRYFRTGNFIYSIEPGVQGPDWLPVFLFKTRTGFCEHFASAFAVLMRQEKVPARLVVGYSGDDQNPFQPDVYAVSQSNAHAWDEVWIPSDKRPPNHSLVGHWLRIDPTSPSAAGAGMQNVSSSDAGDNLANQLTHQDAGLFSDYLPAWATDGLHDIEWRREQVDANWDNLVLSFDPETQIEWAQYLGFGRRASAGLGAACLVAAAICALVFRRWTLRRTPVPPVESLYAAFCRNMARRGIPRAAWEGPLAYTERVAEAFPDDKHVLQRVGDIVARARYGPVPADTNTHEHLKSLLTVLTASQAVNASREKR